MRTIDADKLKKEILRALCIKSADHLLPSEKTIYGLIDNAPTVSTEPQWIPCSKRLPEKAGNYLVTDHKGDIARYIFLDSESSKDYWMRCVKAWMLLPKPYKEGEKNEAD